MLCDIFMSTLNYLYYVNYKSRDKTYISDFPKVRSMPKCKCIGYSSRKAIDLQNTILTALQIKSIFKLKNLNSIEHGMM